jgi:hypothetical protein
MTTDRKAKLLERRAKLDAQLQAIEAREKERMRKLDTRRKIIAGALALEHAEGNAAFAAELAGLLNRYVTRPDDRKLFHFLDGRVPDVTPAASDSFTAAANPDEEAANPDDEMDDDKPETGSA